VNGAAAAACVDDNGYATRGVATRASLVSDMRPVRTSYTTAAPRRAATTRIETPHRDWAKTAMVIGGTTAAGAGLGAIFGGKKGALIGAAIGGGAGTLYEVRKH
jgi:predicted ABC-type sugar transport system permease subunit